MPRLPTIERSWALTCAALVIPIAAMLHHAVFFPGTCMLNPLGAPDYTPEAVGTLLRADHSLLCAAIAALTCCVLGVNTRVPPRARAGIRSSAPLLLIAFAPLSLWLWDVPFAARPICSAWHDERLQLPLLGIVHTRHLYALGLIMFAALLALRSRITRVRRAEA